MDDRFIFLLPFCGCGSKSASFYDLFSPLSVSLTHSVSQFFMCLFRLGPFITFENLMFFSFTDLQWKPGDFMAWINAIKYALNRHKKRSFQYFFLLCSPTDYHLSISNGNFPSRDNDTRTIHRFNQINHVKLNFSSVRTSYDFQALVSMRSVSHPLAVFTHSIQRM